MSAEYDPMNPHKVTLQPRRPGENIKVAEIVLKRRDRNLKAASDRAAQIQTIRRQQRDRKKGKLNIIRAEKLVKNSRIRMTDKRRLQNKTKKPLPKLQKGRTLLVARNGRLGGSKEVKNVIKELGLKKRHTLIFLRNTKEICEKLRTIRPFVFWGAPSFKVAFNLVHKKATFRDPEDPDSRTLLNDNVLIEKHLGDIGILCTEDLVHAVHTCSKRFDAVNGRLWPLQVGDAKKAKGLIHDKTFTIGDLKKGIDRKITQLLGD